MGGGSAVEASPALERVRPAAPIRTGGRRTRRICGLSNTSIEVAPSSDCRRIGWRRQAAPVGGDCAGPVGPGLLGAQAGCRAPRLGPGGSARIGRTTGRDVASPHGIDESGHFLALLDERATRNVGPGAPGRKEAGSSGGGPPLSHAAVPLNESTLTGAIGHDRNAASHQAGPSQL